MAVLATVTDPSGRSVVLTAARWAHIVARHPELADHQQEVTDIVRAPDHHGPDPIAGRERYWRQSAVISAWLRVVVDFNVEPAMIITAFPNRKQPPEWKP